MIGNPRYNETDPVALADGVYHLGVPDQASFFANIPYLVVDGGEAVIIDPGSAKPAFHEVILRKARQVVDLKQIRYMVVQHQDPDLCAALPLFEPLVHDAYEICVPLEAAVLVQHYGMKKALRTLDDGDTLTFGDGRTLTFMMTPYCHFVGAMVTFDKQTGTVFSSDIFGGFSDDNRLYAGDNYIVQMSTFMGEYFGSGRALDYALKRLEKLDGEHGIERLCPQHGCVIGKGRIPACFKALRELETGGQVESLARKHGIVLD